MPAEQIYQPQVEPGATPGTPMSSPADFGAGVGQAISSLGSTGMEIALKQRATSQAADFNAQFAQARLDADKASIDARNNPVAPGGAGHFDRMAKWWDDRKAALGIDHITDPGVRRAAQEQLDEFGTRFEASEYQFQEGARVGKLATDSQASSNIAANRARDQHDPHSYAEELSIGRQGIEALPGVPEDVKDKLIKYHDQTVTVGYINGLNDTNPKAALGMLDAGLFNDILTPEQVEHLRNGADLQLNKLRVAAEREQNAQVAAQKQNEEVLLKQVGDGTLVDDGALAAAVKGAEARGEKTRVYDLQVAQTKNRVNHIYGGGNASPDQITSALAAIEKDKDWQTRPERVIQHNQLSTLLEQQRKAEPNFEPLDFSNPGAIQQRVLDAGRWAATHNGELHILGKDQAEEMGHLAAGGPAGRGQVAAALAQLPGQSAIAAAQQVSKGDYALQQAISIPPNFRAQLFEGEALLKATPALAPKAKIDARWGERGRIAMGYLPAQAQNAVLAGATNVYAFRAAQKGLTEFDQTLWDSTVNDMLDPSGKGGIGMWGRKPFVLPQGMPENELMARLYNMPDEHLGAYYSDHKTPLPKSVLLNRYSPVPIGDGIYRWVDKDGRYAAGRHGIAEIDVRKLAMPAPVTFPGGVPKGPVWVAPPSAPAKANDPYVLMSRGGAGH